MSKVFDDIIDFVRGKKRGDGPGSGPIGKRKSRQEEELEQLEDPKPTPTPEKDLTRADEEDDTTPRLSKLQKPKKYTRA